MGGQGEPVFARSEGACDRRAVVVLERADRDALQAEAVDSLGDVAAAAGAGDDQRAQRLRGRIEAVMRLLDDLGWAADAPGELFELTTEGGRLLLAASYLASRAARRLEPLAERSRADDASRRRARKAALVVLAAEELRRRLGDLAEPTGEGQRQPRVLVSHLLSCEQRNLLFAATWNHLSATAQALPDAVRAEEFDQARQERSRLEGEWRILDAIRWRPDDAEEQFTLTLPPDLLARALTRLRWVERHGPSVSDQLLRVGPLVIDSITRAVTLRDRPVAVTEKEFLLVRMLASEPSRVFTKDELLREIWGYPLLGTARTLDTHACRLRRKLRATGDPFVINVWGVGYRLCDRPPANGQRAPVSHEPSEAVPA